MVSLFLFHRDLRLDDNTGIYLAHQQGAPILPCFIADPRQIDEHPYRSLPALRFLVESLADLEKQITIQGGHLLIQEGITLNALIKIFSMHSIQALYCSRDYTPFSRVRDREISSLCEQKGIKFYCVGDSLLNEPEMVRKSDGQLYKVFTPYYRAAKLQTVSQPIIIPKYNFYTQFQSHSLVGIFNQKLAPITEKSSRIEGGRDNAIAILKKISSFRDYIHDHDFPALNKTTHLSAHIKFGTVSIREVYWAICKQFGDDHPLIRQLYWHDFFTQIAANFPYVFGQPFYQKYENLPWKIDSTQFTAWCTGQTGFPIVDAGMRELNATGFMHNRVRMIVASFLVKDLHMDWREGEKYFAQHLVDYDPAVNNGNWQWAASTGCDAQPYFRIFNPWIQQRKFDPECIYIKRWIPELKSITSVNIHRWNDQCKSFSTGYPAPIVNHTNESKKSILIYRMSPQTQNEKKIG